MEKVLTYGKGLLGKGIEAIPGMLLLFAVGYLSKYLDAYIPYVDYILIAIVLGMAISNIFGIHPVFIPGINSYELWLKTGIVFLGVKLALGNMLSLGATGLLLVLLEITVAIATVTWLSRVLGLPEKTGALLSIGVAICGVSAIIGAAGAIEAKERDMSLAIAAILCFGAIMIFALPILGHWLGLSDPAFGVWAGLSVDNTAEAVATGYIYSDAAGELATLTKLCRNALMGFVILLYAVCYARKGMAATVEHKGKFIWKRFPKFLFGFLVLSLLVTLGFFTRGEIKAIDHMSKWVLMLSFAGVGFRTRFSEMKKAGVKVFLVGLGSELAVMAATLAMVVLVYML